MHISSLAPSLLLAQAPSAAKESRSTEEQALAERKGTTVLSKDRTIDGLPLKAGTAVRFEEGDLVLEKIKRGLPAGKFVLPRGSSLRFHRQTVHKKAEYHNGVRVKDETVIGSVDVTLGGDLKVGHYLFLKGSKISFNSRWELVLPFGCCSYRAIYRGLKIVWVNSQFFHPNGAPQAVQTDEGNFFHGFAVPKRSVLNLYPDGSIALLVGNRSIGVKFGAYTYDLSHAIRFHKNGKPAGGTLFGRQKVEGVWRDTRTEIDLDEKGKLMEVWRDGKKLFSRK